MGNFFLKESIDAMIIVEFLISYNILEKEIKKEFKKNIEKFDNEIINKLFFFHGSQISGRVKPDYNKISFKLTPYNFKVNEDFFDTLKLKGILMFCKNNKLIKKFQKEIPSKQTKLKYFEFIEICVKLLKMRNVLSHNLENYKFKETDIVESFSEENLNKLKGNLDTNWIELIEINRLSDETKNILNNYVYLKLILKILKCPKLKKINEDDKKNYKYILNK